MSKKKFILMKVKMPRSLGNAVRKPLLRPCFNEMQSPPLVIDEVDEGTSTAVVGRVVADS